MARDLKERLDRDWHQFLDYANQAYEAAYADVMTLVGDPSLVERLMLEEVIWPTDGQVLVRVGAYLDEEWRERRG
jgi:hypothetical protein